MKTKTVRLGGGYRLNGGVVERYVGEWDSEASSGWKKTRYKIGARVMLISSTDVSPNAIRAGTDVPTFRLRFDCPDGIGGNSNAKILRYHGWRGTTNDVRVDAHGEREIVAIRALKNGTVAVTVGPDLRPTEK